MHMSGTTTTTTTTDLEQAAAAAVRALEALDLGAAFAGPAEAARAAIDALAGPAARNLFPDVAPTTADAIANFEFAEAVWPVSRYGECAADLHAAALDVDHAIGVLLRSGPVLARVRRAAESQAPASAEHVQVAGDQAVARYQRAVALQLAGVDPAESSATILGITVPALRVRLDAAVRRHEEHARVELARLQAERQEAERIIAAAEAADVEGERQRKAEADRAEQVAAWELRKAKCLALAEWFGAVKGGTVRDSAGRAYDAVDIANFLRSDTVSDQGLARFAALKDLAEAGKVPKGPRW
jgi:hypothetical protein